ncbi:hypothetical protein KIPB_008748, partial [Kipferlia bialata]|eukprot:g8748.t1
MSTNPSPRTRPVRLRVPTRRRWEAPVTRHKGQAWRKRQGTAVIAVIEGEYFQNASL